MMLSSSLAQDDINVLSCELQMTGADLFERFAKLESGANAEEGRAAKRRAGGVASGGEEGAKEGEGDDEEEQLQADDDDEAFQEDDDYLMVCDYSVVFT